LPGDGLRNQVLQPPPTLGVHFNRTYV